MPSAAGHSELRKGFISECFQNCVDITAYPWCDGNIGLSKLLLVTTAHGTANEVLHVMRAEEGNCFCNVFRAETDLSQGNRRFVLQAEEG